MNLQLRSITPVRKCTWTLSAPPYPTPPHRRSPSPSGIYIYIYMLYIYIYMLYIYYIYIYIMHHHSIPVKVRKWQPCQSDDTLTCAAGSCIWQPRLRSSFALTPSGLWGDANTDANHLKQFPIMAHSRTEVVWVMEEASGVLCGAWHWERKKGYEQVGQLCVCAGRSFLILDIIMFTY